MIYNSIINDQIAMEETLNYYYNTLAYEAETNIDNTVDKSNTIGSKLKKIIDTVIAFIENIINSVASMINKLTTSNDIFIKDYELAKKNNRTDLFINLITYDYRSNFLINDKNNLYNFYIKMVNQYKTLPANTSHPLNMNKDSFNNYLYKSILKVEDKNVTNSSLYFKYIKEKFRGQKREYKYTAASLSKYESIVYKFSSVENETNASIKDAREKSKNLKYYASAAAFNTRLPESKKTNIEQKVSNICSLASFYVSFCKFYMEMKTEELMNARVILKKFYHF